MPLQQTVNHPSARGIGTLYVAMAALCNRLVPTQSGSHNIINDDLSLALFPPCLPPLPHHMYARFRSPHKYTREVSYVAARDFIGRYSAASWLCSPPLHPVPRAAAADGPVGCDAKTNSNVLGQERGRATELQWSTSM